MSEVVQCPKCHSAVTVGADQAGMRVQCPSCLQQFLAPSTLGSAGATAEDEDWLTLDDSPAPPSPKATATGPADVDNASVVGEDLFDEDPFVDLPAEQAGEESDPIDLFAELPPIPSGGAQPTSPTGSQPSRAQEIGPDEEFRVTCPVCGSVLYAKAKQSGSTIKCSDCYSEVRVPKPPKKKTQVESSENAATFNLADTGMDKRPADPFQKSADELLRKAEEEPDEDEFSSLVDAPSVVGWFKSVFGVFLDPGVIIHFVGLSLLLGVSAALAFAVPIFAIGAFPLALIGIMLSVACGFAIMFGVANEHERIEDWPTVDPTGWFEPMWLVVVATAIAVGPAYVITTLFGAPLFIKIGLVMFCVYVSFPVILLSMLDMQSATTPFSPDVGKSINRCQEDWGAFYFSSGVLFALLFVYFLQREYTPTTVAIGVVLSVAVVFLYFAMLGRLALAIGRVVDLTALEPEDEDDE